ncbi:hypothetical protein NLU13_0298 [Sarocladium strictum]|uniref:MYND-type zinc finger protein samB n=1 Tax=Sarocladium strictum TaxID=5046 RepID=A0AA39GNT2_SARSR|nr:hypothetical protein NLU13_0298 [Sarocladium strictum]
MAASSLPIRPTGVTYYRCANWRDSGPACNDEGRLPCEVCHLVLYCSTACRNAHEDIHVEDCAHGLTQTTWFPKWFAENRIPVFIKDREVVHPLTRRVPRIIYSWGNMPAIDLLDVEFNEGIETQRHLRILTVESDIRHGVQTIARLPDGFIGQITLTYSNDNMDMCARNILLVMLTYLVGDKDVAVDCMIHVWYSAYLKPCHVRILTEIIRPYIAQAAQVASDQRGDETLCRTFVENGRGLRIALTPAQWQALLTYFDFCQEDDAYEPQSAIARNEVMASDAYEDERDLVLLRNLPHCRVAITKFWRDGVVQPFGQDCSEFTIPNPMLFHNGDWTVEELADPFDGWDFPAIVTRASHMPKSDLYGRLYCYLQGLFGNFVKKAHDKVVRFEMLNTSLEEIHSYVEPRSFARIDATAVTESPDYGVRQVFENLGHLLELPEINPHAAVLGLYVQKIEDELMKHEDLGPNAEQREAVGQLLDLDSDAMDEQYSKEMIRCHDALPLVLDVDEAFSRWSRNSGFLNYLRANGLKLKTNHSIVRKWPTRIDLQSTASMGNLRRAFSLSMASPHGGGERLVEIQRVTKELEAPRGL